MPASNLVIERREPQPVAVVRRRGAAGQLPSMIGEVFPAVWAFLERHHIPPAGPPFVRFLAMGETYDFEGGFPVTAPFPGEGDVTCATLPGGEIATALHTGPYDTVAETFGELRRWLDQQGRQPAGIGWEVYVTDPGQVPDPAQWETLVNIPLTPRASPAPEG